MELDRTPIRDFDSPEAIQEAVYEQLKRQEGSNLLRAYLPIVLDAALQEETIEGLSATVLALRILSVGSDNAGSAVRALLALGMAGSATDLITTLTFITLTSLTTLPDKDLEEVIKKVRSFVREEENGIIVDSLLKGSRSYITENGLEELTEEEIKERRRGREGL